jgi:hypothetical protein
MKRLVIILAVLAIGSTAFAGGNPNIQAYISFDQSGAGEEVFEYTPTLYTTFNAYFVLSCLDLGMTVVSFELSDPMVDCPGAFAPPSFTNLLPGNLAIGTWNTGITIASTECMTGTVVVGYLALFPVSATPCCLQIVDHPQYPRWVVDCTQPNGLVDYYCVVSHGSINGATCPEAEVCPCDSPVQDETWGGIKALYR